MRMRIHLSGMKGLRLDGTLIVRQVGQYTERTDDRGSINWVQFPVCRFRAAVVFSDFVSHESVSELRFRRYTLCTIRDN